jgi:hypothetical protein
MERETLGFSNGHKSNQSRNAKSRVAFQSGVEFSTRIWPCYVLSKVSFEVIPLFVFMF